MPRLQVDEITENDSLAEEEPWFRAVPFNEFVDRVSVPSLSVDRTEAVQNRRLRLVQVRQPQHCLGNGYFPFFFIFSICFLAMVAALPDPRTDNGRTRVLKGRIVRHTTAMDSHAPS